MDQLHPSGSCGRLKSRCTDAARSHCLLLNKYFWIQSQYSPGNWAFSDCPYYNSFIGLLFHEFYTGRLPDFSGEYDYAYEALLDDAALSVDTSMEPIGLASLIHGMLAVSPEARPSAEVVFQSLQELQNPVPASDAWVCANCGMKNDMHISNAKFCVQCGWPRNKPAAGTPPSEPWKCGNCGYVNLAVRRDCIKCGAVRGSKTADASADMRAFFEIPEL